MQKRVYRSRKEKMIAGVAGGLGEYFEIDPVILRIIFVVAALAGGWGVLAYILCWIIIPPAPNGGVESEPKRQSTKRSGGTAQESPPVSPEEVRARRSLVPGILLIILGVLLLGNNLIPHFHFGQYWPLILIVLGGGLLWKSYPRTTS